MSGTHVVYSPADSAYGGLWFRVRREDALRSPLVGYCLALSAAILARRVQCSTP